MGSRCITFGVITLTLSYWSLEVQHGTSWQSIGSACQCSDHTPHTASNWSAWLSSQKKASSKHDAQEIPHTEDKQTKDMDYWNHVLCSDETKINLFGSDGVNVCDSKQVGSTKTSVSCLQSSMVVGVSWSGAAWVLPTLGSFSSLREPWMQHVLWHTEAEHDPLPSETGPQDSISTW